MHCLFTEMWFLFIKITPVPEIFGYTYEVTVNYSTYQPTSAKEKTEVFRQETPSFCQRFILRHWSFIVARIICKSLNAGAWTSAYKLYFIEYLILTIHKFRKMRLSLKYGTSTKKVTTAAHCLGFLEFIKPKDRVLKITLELILAPWISPYLLILYGARRRFEL